MDINHMVGFTYHHVSCKLTFVSLFWNLNKRRAPTTKSWLVWRTLVWARITAEQFMEGEFGVSNFIKRGLESNWQ
jgi:hypothetical protein